MQLEESYATKFNSNNALQLLIMASGKIGHIHGVDVGTVWPTRAACGQAGVHTPRYAGISGSKYYGAYSVVLSGRYEDDYDEGEKFIYTGTGGRSGSSFGGTGPQVADQSFDHRDNRALQVSASTRCPVRVIRGAKSDSIFAPDEGYRYDGLYIVEEAYLDKGMSGFTVCKFKFSREAGQPPLQRFTLYSTDN